MPHPTLDPTAVTLVNVLTCDPAKQPELLDLLRENIDKVVAGLDGWCSTNLVASADATRVLIISQWRDEVAAQAMRTDPRMTAYFPRIGALASIETIAGGIAYSRAG